MNIEDYINNGVLLYIMEAGSRGYYIKGDEDIAQNTLDIMAVNKKALIESLIYMHFSTYRNEGLCEGESMLTIWEENKPVKGLTGIKGLMGIYDNYPSGKILSVILR